MGAAGKQCSPSVSSDATALPKGGRAIRLSGWRQADARARPLGVSSRRPGQSEGVGGKNGGGVRRRYITHATGPQIIRIREFFWLGNHPGKSAPPALNGPSARGTPRRYGS